MIDGAAGTVTEVTIRDTRAGTAHPARQHRIGKKAVRSRWRRTALRRPEQNLRPERRRWSTQVAAYLNGKGVQFGRASDFPCAQRFNGDGEYNRQQGWTATPVRRW
jgi:hypothetical protein